MTEERLPTRRELRRRAQAARAAKEPETNAAQAGQAPASPASASQGPSRTTAHPHAESTVDADHILGAAHYDEYGNYLGHPQYDPDGNYVAHALFDEDSEFLGHVHYEDEEGRRVIPEYVPEGTEEREELLPETTKRRRRGLSSIVALLLALVIVVGGGYLVAKIILPGFGGPQTIQDYAGPGHGETEIVIAPGDTGRIIGATLAEAGVVATQQAFVDAFNANPNAQRIAPGTYRLKLEMTATDAVAMLLDPAAKVELRITVPEGWTAAQIYERVQALTGIPVAELEAVAADPAAIGLPAEAGGNPEGWLFPATYVIDPDATAAEVLAPMVTKTISVLDALGIAPEDRAVLLTKASIIEAEVNRAEYYPIVARVIENRLAQGIQLAMDSINSYGLGIPALDLTSEDLATPGPYNSRLNIGLPPTPIGNPGQATIEAALNPADGTWIYFVTVDLNTGETKFTDNYAEFLDYKAEFQQWLETSGE